MQYRTAILLFARTPGEEALYKPLPNGEQVHHALLAHAIGLCSGLEATLIHWHQEKQVGKTFGDRITHAVEQVWLRGFSSVLVLGADTPGLCRSMLRTALLQLEQGAQVLGPSRDGGCYLIGLQRKHFDALQFRALPWNTCKLLSGLHQFSGYCILLPTLNDIDSEKGLLEFVNSRRKTELQGVLKRILTRAGSLIFFENDLCKVSDTSSYFSIRGSPAQLAF